MMVKNWIIWIISIKCNRHLFIINYGFALAKNKPAYDIEKPLLSWLFNEIYAMTVTNLDYVDNFFWNKIEVYVSWMVFLLSAIAIKGQQILELSCIQEDWKHLVTSPLIRWAGCD